MAFAPEKPSKPPFITNLATSPSRNSPTNSAEEANKQSCPGPYNGAWEREPSSIGLEAMATPSGMAIRVEHDWKPRQGRRVPAFNISREPLVLVQREMEIWRVRVSGLKKRVLEHTLISSHGFGRVQGESTPDLRVPLLTLFR